MLNSWRMRDMGMYNVWRDGKPFYSLVRNLVERRPFLKPRHSQKDSIKINLKKLEGIDLIHLAQTRDLRMALVNADDIWVPKMAGNFLIS
jgi:hypothetical protein